MRADATTTVALAMAGVVATGLVAACGGSGSDAKEVVLMTHDSFSLPQSLLTSFTKQTGWTIKTVAAGDAGKLATTVSLTPGKPKADVVYGIDNAFASRPVKAAALESYESPEAGNGASDYSITSDNELTAIDHADVCINVDPAWYASHGIQAPTQIDQLTQSTYKDQTVVLDPATSSPGLGFLLATIANFPGDWQNYWTGLKNNGVEVQSGWETAYNQRFSGGPGKGPKPVVVSYSSSPAENTQTKALLDGCFRQVEYAGVLRGAKHPDAAKKVIDFLLSTPVQQALPESMYVYPVNNGVALPESWSKYAPAPTDVISLDAAAIATRRDDWQKQWRQIMGR